jgi:hypothetical protein
MKKLGRSLQNGAEAKSLSYYTSASRDSSSQYALNMLKTFKIKKYNL